MLGRIRKDCCPQVGVHREEGTSTPRISKASAARRDQKVADHCSIMCEPWSVLRATGDFVPTCGQARRVTTTGWAARKHIHCDWKRNCQSAGKCQLVTSGTLASWVD